MKFGVWCVLISLVYCCLGNGCKHSIVPLEQTEYNVYTVPVTVDLVMVHPILDTGSASILLHCCDPGVLVNCIPPEHCRTQYRKYCLLIDQTIVCTDIYQELLPISIYIGEEDDDLTDDKAFYPSETPTTSSWYWEDSGGTFGVSYNGHSSTSGLGFLNGDFFVLDLREFDDSVLHVIDNCTSDNTVAGYETVEWSEPQFLSSQEYHRMVLYDMNVCGESLFYNYSSSWTAFVDTGTRCLGLPDEFFEGFVAHTPVVCIGRSSSEKCYLDEDWIVKQSGAVDLSSLPSFQFRLSEQGRMYNFSLQSLILQNEVRPGYAAAYRVCIYRKSAIGDNYGRQIRIDDISFGTLVLRDLYMYFDSRGHRVGVAQKESSISGHISGSDELCRPRPTCVGQQTYFPPQNKCIDRDCGMFFFHVLDKDASECRLSVSFIVLLITLLLCFGVAEFFLTDIYRKRTRVLYDRNQVVNST